MTAATVTGYTDPTPCPRAEILIPAVTGAVSARVWRTWDGNKALVRGGDGMTVSGAALLIDFDVPFGTAVTYTYTTTDNTGTESAESAPSTSVLLAMGTAWWHDPLDPSTGTAVALSRDAGGIVTALAGITMVTNGDGTVTFSSTDPAAIVVSQNVATLTAVTVGQSLPVLRLGSLTGWTWASQSSSSRVIGDRLPVGSGGPVQAPSKIPLQIRTNTTTAAEGLAALLTGSPLLCLRLPVRVPLLDRLLYTLSGDLTPDVRADLATVVWTIAVDQVRGPSLNVLLAPRSMGDLDAEAATMGELDAAYAGYTMLDVDRGI